MGLILINVPDIEDKDLVYDEQETRTILKFFWPSRSAGIDSLEITNDVRRFAQTALIAAIEGTYEMGFIAALAQTVIRPGSGIKSLGKKLARRFVKHWWKHATLNDLEDVKIYDGVRNAVAVNMCRRLDDMINGLAMNRQTRPFYARIIGSPGHLWS